MDAERLLRLAADMHLMAPFQDALAQCVSNAQTSASDELSEDELELCAAAGSASLPRALPDSSRTD